MRLILTEDVANLGSLGDTVEVKAGYGRNYLIPQGKALLADNRASKELQHRWFTWKNCVREKLYSLRNRPQKSKNFNSRFHGRQGREADFSVQSPAGTSSNC